MDFAHNPPIRLLTAFTERCPDCTPTWLLRVPEREMWAVGVPLEGEEITVVAIDHDGQATFTPRSARFKRTALNRPLPRWARYPAGVALALANGEYAPRGMLLVIAGDEPAGPRYDHALGMAFAAVCYLREGHAATGAALIELVEQVRRDYVEMEKG